MTSMNVEVFVPGRVCLIGEHSDWAGGFRRFNSAIVPGSCLVGHTHTHAPTYPLTQTYACMRARRARTHARARARMDTCTHALMHARAHARTHGHMQVCGTNQGLFARASSHSRIIMTSRDETGAVQRLDHSTDSNQLLATARKGLCGGKGPCPHVCVHARYVCVHARYVRV